MKNVLFIGSFKKEGKSGNVGGQMFACRTLIESDLKDKLNWILLDTTASTNKSRPLFERAFSSLRRWNIFFYKIFFTRISIVLIFSSSGFSLIEKGLMVIISKWFGKKVIFAPRSGFILKDIESSCFYRKFFIYVVRNVDRLICQGESWKKKYFNISGGNEDKYVVIHNWIDAEKYLTLSKPLKRSEKIVVLFLGWINVNKGIFDLIDAVNTIGDELNFEVLIAGDGDSLNDAKQRVIDMKLDHRIKFLGWVVNEEKYTLLTKSDIFVLCSYNEGYPNSLMEAMASKIAPIATRVGGVPDLISNGLNGLLVEAGNIKELSDALETMIKDEQNRNRISSNARNRIIENNTISIGVKKFEELLDNI